MRSMARKKTALKDAADRLRCGAQALRVVIQREDSFYSELARLQGHWVVRLNHHGEADSPFLVQLHLGEQEVAREAAAEQPPSAVQHSAGPGPGAAQRPVPTTIPIIKEPSGQLRVQIEQVSSSVPSVKARVQPPQIYTGARRVHEFLLQQFNSLLWQKLQQRLLEDVHTSTSSSSSSQPRHHSTFLYSFAQVVLGRLMSSRDGNLLCLRPMLLEHFIARHMCDGTLRPLPRRATPSTPSSSLLFDLNAWLNHVATREMVRSQLDAQAVLLTGTRIRWLPTSSPCTAACLILLPLRQTAALPQQHYKRVLVRIKGTSIELDGGEPGQRQAVARWAPVDAQGGGSISRVELPTLLFDLAALAAYS